MTLKIDFGDFYKKDTGHQESEKVRNLIVFGFNSFFKRKNPYFCPPEREKVRHSFS